ncbi:four helix bundle protein [Rubrivirga sp. IMCC45206]|uniref:four helix bundle protein n=1 Tax=Rubrivirga sp. IMCC45206 TaxID=3391614 RepID=UPI00398FE31F
MKQPDGFQDWESTVPESIRGDVLWRMTVYRLALFLGDLSWDDVTTLHRDGRTRRIADQLYRAVGSISANVAEGYSRGSGKDRARFYEYSLGSAREARDWYFKGRHLLGAEITTHRLDLLAEICRQLLGTIRNQPGRSLREPGVPYSPDADA